MTLKLLNEDEEEHASINTSLRDVLRAMGDIRSSIDDLRGDLKQLQDTVTGMGQQPSSSTNNKVPHEHEVFHCMF
ncbi:hypothetical protein AALO_G00139620 [Alosa alosa]|uniref:Uncharacterized protein n=1 Tax=Alosa alosa TaxID=278164 RepID=A0AAV6GIJ9_9TELE|nr:hypothetical protein AALO_G00139620 [Alosa alosa]